MPGTIAVLIPRSSPARVQQRAAGVAGVDRRVGLDHRHLDPADRGQLAADGGDDAGRHGAREAEGVADRDRPSGRRARALRQGDRPHVGRRLGIDEFEQREVDVGVGAHDAHVERSS
jgi:hypothetical protein